MRVCITTWFGSTIHGDDPRYRTRLRMLIVASVGSVSCGPDVHQPLSHDQQAIQEPSQPVPLKLPTSMSPAQAYTTNPLPTPDTPENFVYLRCNATGWEVDDLTRMQAVGSNVFALTYTVTDTWMTSSGDQCTILETDQYNDWGSWQRAYTRADATPLQIPNATTVELGWTNFAIVYPELGEYTATLNTAASTLTIEQGSGSEAFALRWPLLGQQGSDWVVNGYVDLDPTSGVVDYRGGSRTYDGHLGIDVDVSTFREMDSNVPAVSASAGEVIAVSDDNPDRNLMCTGTWNFVTIRADNGYELIYGHLKKGSVVVEVGQHVSAGDMLGVIGSSGCSTQPHLHLEVYDESGNLLDPFLEGMFSAPPPYDTPLTVMDIVVNSEQMTDTADIIDPLENATTFRAGDDLAIGISLAGALPDDTLTLTIVEPDGAAHWERERVLTADLPHSFWYWNFNLGDSPPPGSWGVEVRANGALQRTYTFDVVAP